MKKSILFLLLISCFGGFSQSADEKLHFVGGMFYGSGYYKLENSHNKISEFSGCLGGRLSLFVTPKFLIGGMGNSVVVNYNPSSNYRIGSGGVVAEYLLTSGPAFLSMGVYSGGGRLKNMHATTTQGNLYLVDFQETPFLFVAPIVTFSYRLSTKIGLTIIADVPFSNKPNWIKSAVNVRGGLVFFR